MQPYPGQQFVCNTQQLIPIIFIILALPSTILFACLTPPFQVADEMDHYFYARSISLGQFLPQQIEGGHAGGIITTTDHDLANIFDRIRFKPKIKLNNEMLASARHLPSGPVIMQNYWGSAIYPPSAYVVPAAAILFSEHIGLDPLSIFYSGRAANAIVYVFAAALAIWLTPVGKFAFALILLLPMSLSQAGSYSADANVFVLSAIVCALLAKEAMRETPTLRGIVFAALLLVPLAATKAPMVALVLPATAIAWRRSRLLAASIGITVALTFVLWTATFVLTEAQSARFATLDNVSNARQVAFLISSPISVVSIARNTLELQSWNYVRGLIGVFGWLDTPLDNWFYLISLICISVISITTTLEKPVGHRLSFLSSALFAAALTFGALYLSWSKVGANIVSGVQGRYFIPILFPSALALAGLNPRGRISVCIGLAPILFLWLVSASYVPLMLVKRFYLQD
jgi:uncharacterized membrane protein